MPDRTDIPRFHTCAEVADVLRTTPAVVAEMCRSGELRATKPNRAWLIADTDLVALIERHSNDQDAA